MRSAQNPANRGIFGEMARLVEQLPHYQESEILILLKGHLLIEELLRSYIDRTLPNPAAFQHKQFLFAKVLMVCRSLTPPKIKSWTFDAAKKLNEVRNEAAHELDAFELQRKLEAFIDVVEKHSKNSVFPPMARGETRLSMAITDLYSELARVLRSEESSHIFARGDL